LDAHPYWLMVYGDGEEFNAATGQRHPTVPASQGVEAFRAHCFLCQPAVVFRTMAEALQLGLDVIATDYGGNTDFCTGPLAHPVRCQEVPIPRGACPCADGHVWGEPDLGHAAELMQRMAARRLALAADSEAAAADPSREPAVLAGYRQRFSFAAAGVRYRARLEELWGQRQELAGRLKWRADMAA